MSLFDSFKVGGADAAQFTSSEDEGWSLSNSLPPEGPMLLVGGVTAAATMVAGAPILAGLAAGGIMAAGFSAFVNNCLDSGPPSAPSSSGRSGPTL